MELKNQVHYVKTDSIKQNERNPRTITKAMLGHLKQSLKDNPDYFEARPIIVDQDGVILAGNMRHKAAIALKLKEVPVVALTITDEKKRQELIVRDNISNGEWDFEILAADFEAADLEAWGANLGEIFPDGLDDSFDLPVGEGDSLEQITFTLAAEQAELVRECLKKATDTDTETFGNENGNGNSLYQICKQWDQQKTSSSKK